MNEHNTEIHNNMCLVANFTFIDLNIRYRKYENYVNVILH